MNLKLFLLIFNGLLLFSPLCWAQAGYNYGRSDINPANIQTGSAGAAPIRPLTSGFPTATSGSPAFPTTPTAFAGIGTGTGGVTNPSNPFGGFGGQNQRNIGGLQPTATTAFGGAAANLPKRTQLQQRPTATAGSSGIYNPNLGQSQYSNAATGRGGTGTGGTGLGRDEDYDGDYSAIPGVPGVDYPIYSQVPQTSFDCNQQPLPGYYSDIEAQCQVFHICALNRTYSFLCPNGTIFSQEVLVCIWWNQYDCASAPSLYANNAFIYDYGGERIPTNSGYQQSGGTAQQIGGGGRTQTNLLTQNQARAPTSSAANIFTPQRLQPGITAAGGGGGIQSLQPNSLSTTSGYSAAGANRFNPPTANVNPQTFPIGGAGTGTATPNPFGAVIRSGNPTGIGQSTGAGGGGGGQSFAGNVPETAFGNAGIATPTTKNREYLPPPNRRT